MSELINYWINDSPETSILNNNLITTTKLSYNNIYYDNFKITDKYYEKKINLNNLTRSLKLSCIQITDSGKINIDDIDKIEVYFSGNLINDINIEIPYDKIILNNDSVKTVKNFDELLWRSFTKNDFKIDNNVIFIDDTFNNFFYNLHTYDSNLIVRVYTQKKYCLKLCLKFIELFSENEKNEIENDHIVNIYSNSYYLDNISIYMNTYIYNTVIDGYINYIAIEYHEDNVLKFIEINKKMIDAQFLIIKNNFIIHEICPNKKNFINNGHYLPYNSKIILHYDEYLSVAPNLSISYINLEKYGNKKYINTLN